MELSLKVVSSGGRVVLERGVSLAAREKRGHHITPT